MSLWCHWQFSRNEEIAFLGEAWQIKWSGVSFYPQSAVTFSEWLKWTAAATSWISNDLRGQIIIIQEDNEKPNKSPQRHILSSAVRFLCMTGEKNNRVLLQSHECNIQVQAAGRNFFFFFVHSSGPCGQKWYDRHLYPVTQILTWLAGAFILKARWKKNAMYF